MYMHNKMSYNVWVSILEHSEKKPEEFVMLQLSTWPIKKHLTLGGRSVTFNLFASLISINKHAHTHKCLSASVYLIESHRE